MCFVWRLLLTTTSSTRKTVWTRRMFTTSSHCTRAHSPSSSLPSTSESCRSADKYRFCFIFFTDLFYTMSPKNESWISCKTCNLLQWNLARDVLMTLAIKRVHNLPPHLSYVSTLPDITQNQKSYVVCFWCVWSGSEPVVWLGRSRC